MISVTQSPIAGPHLPTIPERVPSYDTVAPAYTSLFESWPSVIGKVRMLLNGILPHSGAGKVQSRIITPMGGPGTEAIALAELGYDVVSLDLSSEMVRFAELEANSRELDIDFGVADVLHLSEVVNAHSFDAAVVLGNSVCCLLTPDDLNRAFSEIRATLVQGAPFILSVRDYSDAMTSQARNFIHLDPACECADGRTIFQTWTFSKARLATYECRVHIKQGNHEVVDYLAVCKAWRRELIDNALMATGFSNIRWIDNRSTGSVYRNGLDQWVAVAKAN